jgi:hypothetical protein
VSVSRLCGSGPLKDLLSPDPFTLPQAFYTLDVSQYVIGKPASEKDNFYHCINKALQKREPVLLEKLSGQVTRVHAVTSIL